MSARGHGPPAYGSRSAQAPGMMRHGSYPVGHGIEPLHPEHADSKLVAQSAEIERLAGDNQRLAATHVALRQDLVATQQEIQKLRAHIGSIQTESDIQIRILLEKTAKMEVHVLAGETVRKDLQRAHTEARALVATRQDLIGQIEQVTEELKKIRADVEKVPEMHVELDGLRQEHQKLRSTFEYEKSLNMEKVAQMELMEKDLVGMAREVERLRAEVLNVEKRAHAPTVFGGAYMNQELYPPPPRMHASGGGYVDGYGKQQQQQQQHHHHHLQMGVGGAREGMIPYGGGHTGPAAPGGNPQWGGPPMPSYGGGHPGSTAPGSNPQWGGPPYDGSYSRA
ncbi:protein FLX-like 4 [Cynara cardunculus var. scolymus]|uniref:protein FLX-like 4 n=1 Tax=Cynara cardunculus var. scolymus TaxID=59895 RepID=UPI000D630FB8|nr:protein FLX-like 4 [Cynara cardunculus var. scolymus]